MNPRLVIVGAGFGGLMLARKLKKSPFDVLLIDKNNYHTFQPLLYQVATSGLEADSIAFPIRKIFNGYPRFKFRMAEVFEVNATAKTISTSIGTVEYDYLVIATGSQNNYFNLKSLEETGLGLKSVIEALNIRSLILQNLESALLASSENQKRALLTFVIIGGGPTGVEVAGALAEFKKHILPVDYPEIAPEMMRILLIEASPRLLPGMSEPASQNASQSLAKLGIEVSTDERALELVNCALHTSKNRTIPTHAAFWTAGVKGCPIEGVIAASKVSGGRIPVDEYNRIGSHRNIFAIGDVALQVSEEWKTGYPMMAPPAIQQAKTLAKNLLALHTGHSLTVFKFKDKGSMATIGRNMAVADRGRLHLKGYVAWVLWLGLHLFMLMGFRNRLVVFINWVWSYLSYDKGTRLIIRPYRSPHEKENQTYQSQ